MADDLRDGFCCAMRRHFLVGLIGHAPGPAPVELVDFSNVEDDGSVIVYIKYCPFCGKPITRDQHVRYPKPRRGS